MNQNIPFDLLACNRTSSPAVVGWFDFMFRQEPSRATPPRPEEPPKPRPPLDLPYAGPTP
jgi:hypothetical protein